MKQMKMRILTFVVSVVALTALGQGGEPEAQLDELKRREAALEAELEAVRAQIREKLVEASTAESTRPRLVMDLPPVGFEAADCLKMVFQRYCLGGPEKDLPKGPVQAGKGAYEWTVGDAVERVSVYEGQIYRVSKIYRPATRPTYDRLLRQLREKYGWEEPAGRTGSRWRKPGWTLQLAWTGDGSAVYLTYSHEELSKKAEREEL